MVLERYNACQTVAFCGVFPEIKRAWATVDSRLYLWRYDRWCAPGWLQGQGLIPDVPLCMIVLLEPDGGGDVPFKLKL